MTKIKCEDGSRLTGIREPVLVSLTQGLLSLSSRLQVNPCLPVSDVASASCLPLELPQRPLVGGVCSAAGGRPHSQVLKDVLAQVPGQALRDFRLQQAPRGPAQHLPQDLHTLQGIQHLETPLQRDEKQAAVHSGALQGLLSHLSQVYDHHIVQVLKEGGRPGVTGRAASQLGRGA